MAPAVFLVVKQYFMGNKGDYIDLVKQAQLGDEKSVNSLAELARERLRAYLYRLTLAEDLTQDILQESMLQMLKFLDKLQRPDRFWPWLFRIAGNNLRDHRNREQLRRRTPMSKPPDAGPADRQQGLENLIGQDLKRVISAAMSALKPRHRKVLILRCYEDMTYSDISEVMECSEFAARRLFYRAKKALARQLSRRGLGKGSLLIVLVLFGKMTATSEAAAANISVTAATVKVGAAASLAAMATSKTAVVSLAAAGVIAAGTVATTLGTDKADKGPKEPKTQTSFNTPRQTETGESMEQCWYFFPEGAGKPVMMRLLKFDTSGGQSYCRCLQNQHANYHYDKNIIYLRNSRMYNPDLSVQRLPTDSKDLSEFIAQVEGKPADVEYVSSRKKGLLVICKRSTAGDSRIWRIDRHVNVLEEEYFQLDWPESTRVIDDRGTMHRRGWTYFRIAGRIGGEQVVGVGRAPFVYATSRWHYPWLRLQVGNRLKTIDSGAEAFVCDESGKVVARYPGGSFFKGLGRPWEGLHTIDTIRRDAAEKQVWFETKRVPRGAQAEVLLSCEQTELTYTIDMEKDVVERMTFSASNGSEGELTFSYLQEVDRETDEFAAPKRGGSSRWHRDQPGMFWLVKLVDGSW